MTTGTVKPNGVPRQSRGFTSPNYHVRYVTGKGYHKHG